MMEVLVLLVMIGYGICIVAFFLNRKSEETLKTHKKEVQLTAGVAILLYLMIYICIYYEIYSAIKFLAIAFVLMIMATICAIKCFKLYLKDYEELRKIFSSISMELLEEE